MRTQGYYMKGQEQANAVLTSLNYAVMAQLAQMTLTMNTMRAQLKTIASAQNNQERPKIKVYYCSCWINFTHRSNTCSLKIA